MPPAAAIVSLGSSGARAPKISGGMCFITLARALTGAGKVQLTMLPSGATTVSGRTRPSLFGTWGTSMHLIG